jgi:hypothetical protein
MNQFTSLRDYERCIYRIRDQYPTVQSTNLVIVPRGRRTAILRGQLFFEHGYHLAVLERLSFDLGTVVIESYGYEVWHGSRKIMWYDSQPHPNDQELQASHPHHKHVPPDIKHNRIPAPQLSFIKPNLLSSLKKL